MLSPVRLLLSVLAIIFLAGAWGTALFPMLLPDEAVAGPSRPILEGLLVVVLATPALWWAVIRPLRRAACAHDLRATILSNLPDALITADSEGIVRRCNAAVAQIFGYAPGELAGRPVRDLVPCGALEAHEAAFRRAALGAPARTPRRPLEVLGQRKDGTTVPLELHVTPWETSGTRFFTGRLRDISPRKRAEEALERQARQLEAVRVVSEELVRELDLGKLLRLLIARAAELVGASAGTVYLWHADREVLVPRAWHGLGERQGQLELRLGEAIAGSAALAREGLVVNDYRGSPFAHPVTLQETQLTASLGEPLLYRGELVGAITLARDGDRTFTPQDQALVRLFAAQAAIAVENARLFGQATRRNEEVQALLAVTNTVSRSLDVAAIAQAALRTTLDVLRVDAGRLYIFDEPTQQLRLAAHHGLPPDVMASFAAYAPGEGAIGQIFQTGRSMVFTDFTTDARYKTTTRSQLGLKLGFRSAAGLPIVVQGHPVGVIYCFGRAVRDYTEQDLAFLSAIGGQIGMAIENARLYEQARRNAAELEARVEARTRELETANQQLEAVSRHKTEFLANMSHEIRTPLSSIIGFSDLLLTQTVGPLNDRQLRFVSHVQNSGQHLVRLINDILDLSKVEAGKLALELRPVSVKAAVEDVLTIVGGVASQKRQRIVTTIPDGLPELHADPVRFKQILLNLLSNAVKFTPDTGTIAVTVRHGGVVVEIAVADTGAGISSEDLPKLFKEFVQLKTTQAQNHEGSGLGLALTKRLVELHGGRIAVHSDGTGKGSTFTVAFPVGGARHRPA
ncbi:MAG: GAF domain-containing protein [Candidatus Methylomirabilales bacterium]